MISYWLLALCSVFDLLTYFEQLQYNKLKKSVRGLSLDFTLFNHIGYFSKSICCLYYRFNLTCLQQYRNRFPVHPHINTNAAVLLVDLVTTVVSLGVLMQLYCYKKTMNEYQGLSSLCGGTCLVFLICFAYVLHLYATQQMKVILLDVIDLIWLIGNCANTVKLIPQIFMNFLSRSSVGLAPGFLFLQWSAYGLSLLGKLFPCDWWNVPVNSTNWMYLLVYGVCLVMLTSQKLVFYRSDNPVRSRYEA